MPLPRPLRLCRLPSKLRRRARRSRIAAMLLVLGVLALLFAPLYLVYKPPALLTRYLQHRWPDVLWHVRTPAKVVALTIDDAPSAHTDEIADVLAAHDAAATFFVIGAQADGREAALQRLVRGGNELANHGMRDEPARALPDATLAAQLHSVDGLLRGVYAAAGAPPPPAYYRPGSGFFSARMRALLARLGYRLVMGDVYPHDPQIPYWRVNAAHILSMVRPGSIIICHDRRAWTAPMLRKVLPGLQRRGYRVVTVTQLLAESEAA